MDRETALKRICDRNIKNGKVPVYEMTEEEGRAIAGAFEDPYPWLTLVMDGGKPGRLRADKLLDIIAFCRRFAKHPALIELLDKLEQPEPELVLLTKMLSELTAEDEE